MKKLLKTLDIKLEEHEGNYWVARLGKHFAPVVIPNEKSKPLALESIVYAVIKSANDEGEL